MTSHDSTHEKPGRILVIDDSKIERFLLRERIEAENFELIEASSGSEGLAQARAERPDLILLDLGLPGWDGFETLKRLKDDPLTRSIPIIFLSGAATTVEKARGLDLGAVDFVTKPFDPIELRARVRAALRMKHLQDQLEEQAHLDGLTGLGNRHAMQDRLAAEWAACRRRGSPLALLIADLDHFKRINDEHGHSAGDEVLRRVAQTLRSSVRASDLVARYGGEEFVVIAPECDLSGALILAERFRANLAALRVVVGGRVLTLTTSIGVATAFDPRPIDVRQLLLDADRALYQAKHAGRNMVRASTRGTEAVGAIGGSATST